MTNIFSGYESDLKEIKKIIELFIALEDFAQESYEEDENDFIKKALGIRESIKNNRNGNVWVSGILMLYVAGRFENYARTIMEETSTEIAKKHDKFKDLPTKFQESLIADTSKVVQNPRKYNHGEGARDGFIKNLYNNIHNDDLNTINYKCISITERNMKADVITELFSKIHYKDIWKDICSQANMRRFFEGANTDKTMKECKDKINAFMDMRNSIAHSSGEITWISKEEGLKNVDFFIEFGRALKDVCPIHVAQQCS